MAYSKRMISLAVCVVALGTRGAAFPVLSGTEPLSGTNDLSDTYLTGVDRFMLAESAAVCRERALRWDRMAEEGGKNAAAYGTWIASNRQALARMLGVRDVRTAFDAPEPVATLSRSAVLGETDTHTLYEIRWPVLRGFSAEGLLLEPKARPVRKNIVHLPHAGLSPEQVLGLAAGGQRSSVAGFVFPGPGCRMVIPAIVSRTKRAFEGDFKNPHNRQYGSMPGKKVMTCREFVYRPAYTMGRHLIGYEVQEIMALVDWFAKDAPDAAVRVEGWGEGGLLAFYAGALDTRIGETAVAGYFTDRSELWQEPIDRNVFGLLRAFGDAEIAALIAPRTFAVIGSSGPEEVVTREKGEGGAPGRLVSPEAGTVAREAERARRLALPCGKHDWLTLAPSVGAGPGTALCGAAERFAGLARLTDAPARELRIVQGMDRFSQDLLAISSATRREFLSGLDFSSVAAYDKSAAAYRAYYRDEVMGHIDTPLLPLKPRSRLICETEKYACYAVVMDVLPDFVLYGHLLLPKGIPSGEHRPTVVAQHGRGGTPLTLMDPEQGGRPTYQSIAPRLAEQGYVVFAPQNPYIFEDRYRQLQRKANPLKLSLYSVVLAQYEQMFAWFATLPQVDLQRVAFIGQSYGGKTAVRVPPVMPQFCLSISTGDFNEGVTKMASTRYPFSFALWDEYEIFEFDFGNTFNYSDLAALMAPRPFMAQRGHADGVAWDEFVGYEYALVRRAYTLLKIPERTAIDWFEGGHEIDADAAIAFFDRFLKGQ